MKQFVLSILIAALFVSCAASLPYGVDYPLTEQVFRSRDGAFSGRVPRGWFSSTEDSLVPAVLASLIKDDFSAAIGVKELRLDRLSAAGVEKDGLGLLARISAGLHQGGPDSAAVSADPRVFKMGETTFCSYEISGGGRLTRIVVFSARGKFYECEAVAAKGPRSANEVVAMFTAQQTFLSSLTF